MHAFELRYLLSAGTRKPLDERKSLKNKSAHIVPVPEGSFFAANLIIGKPGTPDSYPLPVEFRGAQALWRIALGDGRPAILVGRILPLDSVNLEKIKYYREELKPRANFTGDAGDAYFELVHIFYSDGGNVLLIVPMGDESVRSIGSAASGNPAAEVRKFRCVSPKSSADIVAPDGRCIAVVEFHPADREIQLVKGSPSTHAIGSLMVRLESNNLMSGSTFTAIPVRLFCAPSVGGTSPRNFAYTIYGKFDGASLAVRVQGGSASLRNRNGSVGGLRDDEEIVLSLASPEVKVSVALDQAPVSSDINGQFTLLDQN